MDLRVGNYEWHEFFPHGNVFVAFLATLYFAFHSQVQFCELGIGHDAGNYNIGVVIAIWAPIILVGA